MKNLLIAVLVSLQAFLPSFALAQIGPVNPSRTPLLGNVATSDPATCTVGQLYFKSNATAGSNIIGCTAANTWTAQGSSGITVGSAVSGGGANRVLYEDTSQNLATTSGFTFGAATGEGLRIPAGTATTDVPALAVTRTNNNAAVATGVKFTFTDTTSAAGFEAFGVYGGAAGTTQLLSVGKAGATAVGSLAVSSSTAPTVGLYAGSASQIWAAISTPTVRWLQAEQRITSNGVLGWESGSANTLGNSADVSIARVGAAVLQVGDGSANTNGTIAASGYRITTKPFVLGTAPTVASGGCTSPTAVTSNGTAAFSVGVGTSCSGSQPLVFTLAAATTSWMCHARNVTNGATSAPAQTGAVSTTSVTITNFVRTTGVAGAWTNSDVVEVSCMGY